MIDRKHLEGFDIMRRMSPAIIQALTEHGEEKVVQAGGVVLEQGAPAEKLYGLIEGEVELCFIFKDHILRSDVQHEESVVRWWETVDTSIVLDTLDPGDLLGWSAMTGGETYTATVICTVESRVWAVSGDFLRSLLDDDPAMGYMFMDYMAKLIAGRLSRKTHKLVESWAEAFGSSRVV